MFRREAWSELGGYPTADEIYGWEDYDLWLTVAERGLRAELVRSVVGRQRQQPRLDAHDQRCRHGIELRHTPRTTSEVAMAELDISTIDPASERALRARILELEALVEARTQAIVGLGAQLAELRGDGSPMMAERLREAERQLAELRGTKVMRYTARSRRVYSMLRGNRG